jgi:hypothetical protein
LFPDDPELDIMDDLMEVSVLKQNNGPLGVLKYYFNPTCFSIMKYEGEE